MAHVPAPNTSDFTATLGAATSSPDDLVVTVSNQPGYWRENLVALSQAYDQLVSDNTALRNENTTLQDRLTSLEGADERVSDLYNENQQLLGGKASLLEQVNELHQRLAAAVTPSSSQSFTTSSTRRPKSAKHPDPEKFNGDKTKLELFTTQLYLKLLRNHDHYEEDGTVTEQNKLQYSISRLEGDAFAHVQMYVTAKKVDLVDVSELVDLLQIRFGDFDPVGKAKHELYRLYQTNKDLETFLNTFLLLVKKSKTDSALALDFLYKKLNDEFKDRLATLARHDTLNGLVKQLRKIDSRLKVISKQHQLRTGNRANVNTSNAKPAFKPAPAAPATSVTTTVVPSTATGSHAGPMDLSSAGRRGPISQEEKDRRNRLNLCRYCAQPGHFACNSSEPAKAKQRINEMNLAPTPASVPVVQENEPSLSTVALRDQ